MLGKALGVPSIAIVTMWPPSTPWQLLSMDVEGEKRLKIKTGFK